MVYLDTGADEEDDRDHYPPPVMNSSISYSGGRASTLVKVSGEVDDGYGCGVEINVEVTHTPEMKYSPRIKTKMRFSQLHGGSIRSYALSWEDVSGRRSSPDGKAIKEVTDGGELEVELEAWGGEAYAMGRVLRAAADMADMAIAEDRRLLVMVVNGASS